MMTGIFARLFGCLCILALGVMASHAEPNANVLVCRNIDLSRGIIGRGEKLCNSRWLSGASWLALSVGTNQCAANGIHDNDNLLGGGFKIFDGSAKAIGLEAACDLLDTFLQDTDKVARFVSDKHEPHAHYDDDVLSAITNVVLAVREAGKITPSQNRQYTLDGEALPSECDLIALDALKLDSTYNRATEICGKDYKNTGAALNNFRLTRQCWKKLSWDQALALDDLGHKNFDRMVSDDGKNKACESIEKLQASTRE